MMKFVCVLGSCYTGDYIYWTDWHRRTVERVHKLTGRQRSVIVDQLPDVMGLTAVNMSALTGLRLSTELCLQFSTIATEVWKVELLF